MQRFLCCTLLPLIFALQVSSRPVLAQDTTAGQNLDEKVKHFLAEHESGWEDMNIPARDGQFLHDLIVTNGYTRALEIGTSTGHSGIWIAWALSTTGGRLTTIAINESRHEEALKNFRAAGLLEFIDARLADAHELVRELPGPFDFVFSDADKDWNMQYFVDVAPKMTVGGRYTTHNISTRNGEFRGNTREYVDFLKKQKDFETTIESTRSTGISVSIKKKE
jgi:caffeoyl-CoA O-methyltransferase